MVNVFKAFDPVPTLQADGGNYKLWLSRITLSAAAVGGSDLLKASRTGLADPLLVAQLRAAITAKIHDSIFTLVANFEHTHEILEFLTLRFHQKTAVSIAHAECQLFSARWAGDMQRHLDRLLRLKDDLADFGRKVDDTTLVKIIISTLPDEY